MSIQTVALNHTVEAKWDGLYFRLSDDGDVIGLDREAMKKLFDFLDSILHPRGGCGYRYHAADCTCNGEGGNR